MPFRLSRPPPFVSDMLRARVFQQLARRNQAANAHGNAGDNSHGAENDAPCSRVSHSPLLFDVHCGLLVLDVSFLRFACCASHFTSFRALLWFLFAISPHAPLGRFRLAAAFPVSPYTRAVAFSCCAFSRSARARAFARRLRMFATVSSMP